MNGIFVMSETCNFSSSACFLRGIMNKILAI